MLSEKGRRQTIPLSKHTSPSATINQCSTNPEHSSMRCGGVNPSRRRRRISEANTRSARLASLRPPTPDNTSPASDHGARDESWRELAAVSTSYNEVSLIMKILASEQGPIPEQHQVKPHTLFQSTKTTLRVQYHQFRTSCCSVIFAPQNSNPHNDYQVLRRHPAQMIAQCTMLSRPKTWCPSDLAPRQVNLSPHALSR